MTADREGARQLARAAHEALLARGASVAVAESLTGGLVSGALTMLPGASATFRGGVVAYATDLKTRLLGVDAGLLARRGAVDPAVAEAMARGVRHQLGATYGLATTGVAGPDPQEGHEPGEAYVAVAWPAGTRVSRLAVPGDRGQVRDGVVHAALAMLHGIVRAGNTPS